uniref:Retrotransposon gag domain-containing protein n=1 Tax=Amphimedon queenslandica TaxID=400682 RepID=A0A1X7T098_AMPQE
MHRSSASISKQTELWEGEAQKAVFISVIGALTYGMLKSLLQPHSLQDDVTLDLMRETLEKHFDPKPSPITQQLRFFTQVRKQGEYVAIYVAELQDIGEHCDFGDSVDAMIRDRMSTELAAQDITCLSGKPQQIPAVQNLPHRKDTATHSKIDCFRCKGLMARKVILLEFATAKTGQTNHRLHR